MEEVNIKRYIETATLAGDDFMKWSQKEIDDILYRVVEKIKTYNQHFAEIAVLETKKGNVKDKLIKNNFVTNNVYENIKDKKTVGLIDGTLEIADPVGIICALTPMTNPTSTVLFKSLIALKTRNPIIFAFHPHAYDCSREVAETIAKVSQDLGAPQGWIQWLPHCDKEYILKLMSKSKLILATGGSNMVNSAYSSGTPAIGVGPGNCPAYIHESADLNFATEKIIDSKSFDNGMICASEQSIIVDSKVYEEVVEILKNKNCYFTTPNETKLLEKLMFSESIINAEVVGKSPQEIAIMAGFEISSDSKIIVVQTEWAGDCFPLSKEKLSPIITLYWTKSFDSAIKRINEILTLDGMGHTASIHSRDDSIINVWAKSVPAGRLIVNQGSSFGAIGLNNSIQPSLTLGCGTYGNNSTIDNISVEHLINKKRIVREN